MFSKGCSRLGGKPMDWLDSLKVAIATQDVRRIETLMEQLPQFDSLKEMEEALYLMQEGVALVESLKTQTRTQMELLKKNIDFLESTAKADENSFDVSS